MPGQKSILLVDGLDARMQVLADRLRLLDFDVVRTKTPEEAFQICEDPRFAVAAALIPPELPVSDLGEALAALRGRVTGAELTYVVAGPRPEPATLERLRAADVQLALWEPFEDGRLRFQVNRALAGLREVAPRCEVRVPAELAIQVWTAGRRKSATTYTLSAAGSFVETPRPTPTGVSVVLELPLGPGRVHVEGRVAFTNVPGNLRKRNLPIGMAVAFTAMQEEVEKALRQRIALTASSLRV